MRRFGIIRYSLLAELNGAGRAVSVSGTGIMRRRKPV